MKCAANQQRNIAIVTEEEFSKYVGKHYGEDFTKEDLQDEHPKDDVFVARLGALAIANFRPDRIRVWLDDEDRVVKVVRG